MDDAPRGRAVPRSSRLPAARAALAVAVRPRLWATALRQARRLVVPGWWRHPPFVPKPDAAYLRFRLETQYGAAADQTAAPADVVSYLDWCRAEHRAERPEGHR
jgi:hypothetical protein